MRNIPACALVGVLAAVASGCATDPSSLDSQDEAEAAFRLTMETFSAGAEESDGSTEFVAECREGGSITFSSSRGETESADGFATEASVTSVFQNCTVDGTTIDGTLEFGYETTDEGDEVTIDGDVDYVGAITGLCRYDVSVLLQGSRVGIAGTFCGFPASELGTQVIP